MTASQQRPPRAAGAVTLGFEMAVPIALFGLVGYWLDGKFGSAPWYLLGGCGLGMLVAIYTVWKHLRTLRDDESGR